MDDRIVRVLLVDDHEMVLDAMAAILTQRDRIELVGMARSRREALRLLETVMVDVIVSDQNLGDGRGTDLVPRAQKASPPIPVLLVTGIDDRKGIEAALKAGCAGFVSKSQSFDQLVDSVFAVASGAAVFPAALLTQTLEHEEEPTESDLSPRECEILQLLADAQSTSDISDQLHLSVHTVRNHIKQVLTKLGAHSQLEAVVIAARAGTVTIS